VENKTHEINLTYRWLLENVCRIEVFNALSQTEMSKNDEFFIEGEQIVIR
jgi:hypothetical protein